MPSKLALIGEETLLGRELKEVLEARGPDLAWEGYAASGEGNFSERDGETVFVRALDATSIAAGETLLLAGSREGAERALTLAREAAVPPMLIDCTGLLALEPEARLVAPLLEDLRLQDAWLFTIAHPAAAALALVLVRLAKYRPIRMAVAHVLEPASERGKRGLMELHGQTASLLAFKTLDKSVFDAQLAFNVLPAYGEDAPIPLRSVEDRIERELATLLSRRANGAVIPMPSLRLMQAPVFHGYSISLWLEFEHEVRPSDLEEALASAQIEVRRADEEAPNNAGVAGQSGLQAGDIRVDSNNAKAAWIWIAGDNLRLVADAAVDVLREAAGR